MLTAPTMLAEVQDTTGTESAELLGPDFDLDVQFVEMGSAAEELMRPTDDGCGSTCQSACISC